MINNSFEYILYDLQKEVKGHHIIIDLEIPDIILFALINTYPTNNDDPHFFRSMQTIFSPDMDRNVPLTFTDT